MAAARGLACGRLLGDTKIIVKTLFCKDSAICISNMLLIFMQFADSLNLYSLLVASGLNAEEAKAWKGVYDRGQPLIQFGVVAATSMSLSLVPLIANEKMKGHNESLRKFIQLALKGGFVIGLGAAAGLFGIMEPTNIMLFENAKGTEVLRLLGWMILPASLIITVVAVLQGLGLLFFPAVVVLGGFAAKYAFNVLFIRLRNDGRRTGVQFGPGLFLPFYTYVSCFFAGSHF